jgi:hypothetical protein
MTETIYHFVKGVGWEPEPLYDTYTGIIGGYRVTCVRRTSLPGEIWFSDRCTAAETFSNLSLFSWRKALENDDMGYLIRNASSTDGGKEGGVVVLTEKL